MTYRFGLFEYWPDAGELYRDGVRVRLEPQPARALTLLLERAGDLVSRDEMRAHLWGEDTHVDFDRGLGYCIRQIRAALRDQSDNPRFLETLPRRGFRFLAPVERVDPVHAPAPAPDAAGTPAPQPARAPIGRPPAWALAALGLLFGVALWAMLQRPPPERAVLAIAVFDNETGLAQYDSMVAALGDDLVVRLTGLAPDRLAIIGNSAVLRRPRAVRDPAAIKRETGAGYLLFGQLQRDDAGVRLLAHLIRLDDETHLWVTRVVRAPDALMGLEATLADRVAEAVRLHLVDRVPDAPRSTP